MPLKNKASLALLFSCLIVTALLFLKKEKLKKSQVTIYSSLASEKLSHYLSNRFKDVSIQIIETSEINNRFEGDIFITSSPHLVELKKKKELLPYVSRNTAPLSNHFKEADNMYSVVWLSFGTFAHSNKWSSLTKIKSWEELSLIPEPLYIPRKEEELLFSQLSLHKKNSLVENLLKKATYLESSEKVSQKLNEEKALGIILMKDTENLKTIIPTDGLLIYPTYIAISSFAKNPSLCQRIVDELYSKEFQKSITEQGYYSPFMDQKSPQDLIDFKLALNLSLGWTQSRLEEIYERILQKYPPG